MTKSTKKRSRSKKASKTLSANNVQDNNIVQTAVFSNADTDIDRLSAIELSDYSYLSDIYILDNYDGNCVKDDYKLAFKYDDELRYFLLSDDTYYFPSLNKVYPKRLADYFSTDRFKEENYNNLSNIFNQQNLFILQLDDYNLLDNIGKVSIPLKLNNNKTLRVYEDYSELKYDISDPRFYEYVHITVDDDHPLMIPPYDGTPNTVSALSIDDKYQYPMTVDEMFTDLGNISGYYFSPLYTENEKLSYESDYYIVEINKNIVENTINELFKIYINYKYNNGKITLYFNYYNYLNSPFIKILDDGLSYLDIIDGTYLKLEPGENGVLDIIFQLKCYSGQSIIGYKNIIIASYRLYNISDDKPKFLIKREHQIEYNKYSDLETANQIEIYPHNYEITNENTNKNEKIKFNVNISIIHSYQNNILFSFEVDYPEKIITYTGEQNYAGYNIRNINGILYISVKQPNITIVSLPFETNFTVNNIQNYNNTSYSIDIIQADELSDNKIGIDFKLGRGIINIKNTHIDILISNQTTDTQGNISSDIIQTEDSTNINTNLIKLN